MTDTHKCLNCGETMTEQQAKSTSGCPHCYSRKSIVKRSPEDIGENHQEKVVMAAKSAPKKSVPEKAAPVKPEAKKGLKKAPLPPVEAAKMAPAPVSAPKVEGVKTGKKFDSKEYAARVKSENEAAAAKKAAPAPAELSEEDKKREAARIEKLDKKKKALNDFTKNGAPELPADADENATILHAHNVKAYNEYVGSLRKEIDQLSIPLHAQSPAAHIVKFDKSGVAKKLSPEDGAKELQKAVKKPAAAKQPDVWQPKCICRRCVHIPIQNQCPKDCDENVKKCALSKFGKKCAEKAAKGDVVCIESLQKQGVDPRIIANYRKQWNLDTKLPQKSSAGAAPAKAETKVPVKPAVKPAKK